MSVKCSPWMKYARCEPTPAAAARACNDIVKEEAILEWYQLETVTYARSAEEEHFLIVPESARNGRNTIMKQIRWQATSLYSQGLAAEEALAIEFMRPASSAELRQATSIEFTVLGWTSMHLDNRGQCFVVDCHEAIQQGASESVRVKAEESTLSSFPRITSR